MLIREILNNQSDQSVYGISYAAQSCAEGDLFFCLHSGGRGTSDARLAKSRGAAALVTEERIEEVDLPQFVCSNIRETLALASHRFYGKPSERMTMVAVTGTNGKTTTTHIIKSILDTAGHKTGLIGTNSVIIGNDIYPPTLTTPDPPILHKTLKAMAEEGVDTVIMEASAHALFYKKLDGITFAVSAFTNLTQDHLDFFGNMNDYKAAKASLFCGIHSLAAVVNVDDEFGRALARYLTLPIITYGSENPSDVFGIDYQPSISECRFIANVMDDIMEMKYVSPGRFNMSNVLCAAAVAKALGVPSKYILSGVRAAKRVKGRFNIFRGRGKTVIIDYAHTPDGLKSVITAVREITPGRVITVFGCGGDRDRTKRAAMGEIASELSDYAVITSDNPRSEPPMSIIREVRDGIKRDNFCMFEDRGEAIHSAIAMCGEADTVLIAGKGHEDYQELASGKLPFSDELIVSELLK